MNIQSVIEKLDSLKQVIRISKSVDKYFEAAHLIHEAKGQPIILEDVGGFKVVSNIFGLRETISQILGYGSERNLLQGFIYAFSGSGKIAKYVGIPACQELVDDKPDLASLPVLKHYRDDGGQYITSAIAVVNDPLNGRNLSFHRILLKDKNRAAVRIVERRGLDTALKNTGFPCPAAFLIGAPYEVLFASALSPDKQVDEMVLAASLCGEIHVCDCTSIPVEIPADTEIVIEGYFTGQRTDEGPFVDLTGTMDYVRSEHVFEIKRITRKRNPLYYAILPGESEHRNLMGMPKEIDIFKSVNRFVKCLDVRMTPGGCSWLHAAVQIEKENNDDPVKAIHAAFDAHPSLKLCVIVDGDIDLDKPQEIEWAVATRFQAGSDLVVMKNMPSSSLDPSATHTPGEKSLGSKMGLDATIKGSKIKFLKKKYI